MIGVGIDLVELKDLRAAIERTPELLSRLFAEVEIEYSNKHNDPIPSLAARFAAKEAAMKALGVGIGGIDFHDIVVDVEPSGKPILKIGGRAKKIASELGGFKWHVSLTHSRTSASAVVILE